MTDSRVACVFGGSAPRKGDPAYAQAESLGRELGAMGWTVATGGYGGTMEAVSKGAVESGGRTIGVTCDQIETWRHVKPNAWIQEEMRFATLRERLYHLIELGDVLLALPGGIGTLSELALSWSLIQTQEIKLRPMVLIGDQWRETFDKFLEQAGGYVQPKDTSVLNFAQDVTHACHYVRRLGS